jgi:hypothetical protein
MNMTLMEKARCMLSGAGLGKNSGQRQWVLHVTWSTDHPHQCWMTRLHKRYGLVRNLLTHLKVFGCDAYVHVPKENMGRIDKKDEKCIFIGYKDGLKGYKLWNPETKKVVHSRDVVFREMKDVVKHEVLPGKEEPKKIDFDLKDDESDSTKEHESEEEDPHTPVLRRSVRERRLPKRYTPSDFRSNFSLSITDDDPRIVREAVDSKKEISGKGPWMKK